MKRITRLFVLLTMLALVIGGHGSNPVQAAGTWELVGPADFSYADTRGLSLDVDGGIPYVAYTDYNNPHKKTVRKFNGTDWITVGEENYSAELTGYRFSLDVDNQIPFVAFYTSNFIPTVMKFNGTNWEVVGDQALSDDGVAALSRLVVDHGTPYLAYFGWEDDYITVKKFDGTSWVNVGSLGLNTPLDPLSLAVDNGIPYLAFAGANEGYKATVMKFDGTNWVTVGAAGFSLGHAENISIAVDNGIPFVAYLEGVGETKITVMKFQETKWVRVGEAGFSATYVSREIFIEVYNGLPYVAFADSANSGKATVMKFNGSNWVTVGQPGFSNYGVHSMDFALDNGIPHVAFTGGYDDKVTVMKFNSSTNSPPTDISLSNDHVPQNLPSGTTVGRLTAIDADLGDTHVYALNCAAPGPDDASFKIGGAGNNQLQTNAVYDYNTKNTYEICVQTDDGSEGIYEKNFTIHVTTVVPSKMGFRGIGVNDGWILESTSTSSRGGLVNTADAVLRIGDNELDREYRSILSFNTINLPDNAIITKVTLKIKRQTIVGTDPFSAMGKLLVDIRTPHFGASAALVKPDFQATASMNDIGDFPKTLISGWYRKIWTSDTFFSLINLKGRTQFRLQFANGDNDNLSTDYIAIYSGNYATVTDRPMLIIEYYVP